MKEGEVWASEIDFEAGGGEECKGGSDVLTEVRLRC